MSMRFYVFIRIIESLSRDFLFTFSTERSEMVLCKSDTIYRN